MTFAVELQSAEDKPETVETIRLSRRDSELVAEALLSAPRPLPALVAAAHDFRDAVASGRLIIKPRLLP